MAFNQPVDIINRVNQRVGAQRVSSFNDQTSKSTMEAAAAYDTLRAVELSKNYWKFATRRVILRAVGIDSVTFTPSTWAAGNYSVGALAAYTPTSGPYNGQTLYWQTSAAKTSSNTTTPDLDPDWVRYLGPLVHDLYNTGQTGTSTTSYMSGELALVPAAWDSGTTYAANDVVSSSTIWYVSLLGSNTNHAVTNTTYWTPWTNPGRSQGTYGQTAGGSPIPLTYPGTPTVYLSLYSSNSDNPVSATGNWLALAGTVAPLQVRYPLGAGPLHDTNTANAYHLPYGFLRRAITDPKAGQTSYLGANSGSAPEDWTPEDQYFVSKDSGPLMMRYIGNVLDVSEMDVLFCEALGAAIAMEIIEPVLQDVQKYQKAAGGYKLAISRARAANMIESGPVTMTESKYITVRA